jgi:nitrogen fixation/metabolism regulation signal transduction histidine kinase
MSRSVSLETGGQPPATVTGLVSTAPADQTIATLQWTSASLGLLGLGIAILLGTLWSSQISKPVERLAIYSRKLAQGEWDEPLNISSVSELQTLVEALDRMRQDLTTYRDKLVTSERHAAWSQMARTVAHEVKNPLTPIAVSIADLKRSYDNQRPDFPEILDQAVRTISDEVDTLKRLLQEFSDFARLPAPAFAPCGLSVLMADLAALYNRDVADGRLRFSPPEREITVSADAGQIRQALINLIKNGLEAVDGAGQVVVMAAAGGDRVELSVSDTGPGLSAEQRTQLFQPGFTTKPHGSGLGLTIVERIVNEHRGAITVDSSTGTGTTFRIRLPLEARA